MKRKSRRNTLEKPSGLTSEIEIKIRFGEVDSMGIVWHGNYANYLEEGRDSFGADFDFNGVDIYHKHGFFTPLVNMNVDYKLPLLYGDTVRVETSYVLCNAARIQFSYKLYRVSDGKLVTEAQTKQVFTTQDGNLYLTNPDFYVEWKKRWGLS